MATPLQDAKAHLVKAQEFLAAAESEVSAERYNAATSNAVLSGINSKDAICLTLTAPPVRARITSQQFQSSRVPARPAQRSPRLSNVSSS